MDARGHVEDRSCVVSQNRSYAILSRPDLRDLALRTACGGEVMLPLARHFMLAGPRRGWMAQLRRKGLQPVSPVVPVPLHGATVEAVTDACHLGVTSRAPAILLLQSDDVALRDAYFHGLRYELGQRMEADVIAGVFSAGRYLALPEEGASVNGFVDVGWDVLGLAWAPLGVLGKAATQAHRRTVGNSDPGTLAIDEYQPILEQAAEDSQKPLVVLVRDGHEASANWWLSALASVARAPRSGRAVVVVNVLPATLTALDATARTFLMDSERSHQHVGIELQRPEVADVAKWASLREMKDAEALAALTHFSPPLLATTWLRLRQEGHARWTDQGWILRRRLRSPRPYADAVAAILQGALERAAPDDGHAVLKTAKAISLMPAGLPAAVIAAVAQVDEHASRRIIRSLEPFVVASEPIHTLGRDGRHYQEPVWRFRNGLVAASIAATLTPDDADKLARSLSSHLDRICGGSPEGLGFRRAAYTLAGLVDSARWCLEQERSLLDPERRLAALRATMDLVEGPPLLPRESLAAQALADEMANTLLVLVRALPPLRLQQLADEVSPVMEHLVGESPISSSVGLRWLVFKARVHKRMGNGPEAYRITSEVLAARSGQLSDEMRYVVLSDQEDAAQEVYGVTSGQVFANVQERLQIARRLRREDLEVAAEADLFMQYVLRGSAVVDIAPSAEEVTTFALKLCRAFVRRPDLQPVLYRRIMFVARFVHEDHDLALEVLTTALSWSTTRRDGRAQGDCYRLLAEVQRHLGRHDEADAASAQYEKLREEWNFPA